MNGYLTIPKTIFCKSCKTCGARPVIKADAAGLYVVKCPSSDSHYQTRSGLIDIDDWNRNNTVYYVPCRDFTSHVPC